MQPCRGRQERGKSRSFFTPALLFAQAGAHRRSSRADDRPSAAVGLPSAGGRLPRVDGAAAPG